MTEVVQRYLHGECMVLAAALSLRTGLPMAGIHDDVWTRIPRHVGVAIGEGRYADARGRDLDRGAFLDGYAPTGEIRLITMDEVLRIWGHRIQDWAVPERHLASLELDRIPVAMPRAA